MRDLFDAPYPRSPGIKESGTSREAAIASKPTASAMRDSVLHALRMRPMTADEVAAYIMRKPAGVRPRLSELRLLKLIEPTGERRKNESGMSAAVWRAKA